MFNTLLCRTKVQLFIILFVCALPIILSCFFYFFAKPQGGLSYGHLLEVKSIAQTPIQTHDGRERSLGDIQKGKWALLIVAHAGCDQSCQERLFAMRQYRLGQGAESERVKRIWIINDDALINQKLSPDLLEGVDIVRATKLALDEPNLWSQSIFLIDPQGNQVMRYARNQDHRKIMNEIGKILKHNQGIG